MTRTGDAGDGRGALGNRERLLILGFWTFFGLLESGKAYVGTRMRGVPVSPGNALLGNMPWWYMWALLTPAVFLIAGRFRLDRPPVGRSLAVHAVAGFAFVPLHLVPVGALYYFTHARYNPAAAGLDMLLRRWIEPFLLLDVLTYWVIVGGYHALAIHRRMRATEREAARLEVQAAELRSLTAEARLHALRMELNPHFLFNALNAISGLVRRADRDGAVAMLARLGDLLRVTLNRDTAPQVPLGRELECLELYLDIERVRFADRLTIELDVPDALHDALVPPLILQPLVENAIRHGIAPAIGGGSITVRARRDDDHLHIDIRDTGGGWGDRPGPREGVGLSNTRARLTQLYGPAAAVHTGSALDGGAVVSLSFPYTTAAPTRDRVPATLTAPAETT
jgi:signal transduction histidine kinase